MRRLWRGDEGVTLVETALVLPLLFLLVFGLVDVGLWVFDSTQAAAAARDGARVAILNYLSADVPGSADRATVLAATARHTDVAAPTLTVRCLHPDGTVIACAEALAGEDRVEVGVSWERQAVTYAGRLLGDSARRVSGTSAMNLVGRPASPSS
jgi:Flp pilus assembly protein TadG